MASLMRPCTVKDTFGTHDISGLEPNISSVREDFFAT